MRTIASECAYECVPIIGPLVPSLHRYVSAVGPVRHGGSDRITVGTLLYSAYTLVPRLLFSRRYLVFLSFDVADLGVAELRESSSLRASSRCAWTQSSTPSRRRTQSARRTIRVGGSWCASRQRKQRGTRLYSLRYSAAPRFTALCGSSVHLACITAQAAPQPACGAAPHRGPSPRPLTPRPLTPRPLTEALTTADHLCVIYALRLKRLTA